MAVEWAVADSGKALRVRAPGSANPGYSSKFHYERDMKFEGDCPLVQRDWLHKMVQKLA
jgi:hypothetical protein